jgi:superfamily II DNA or RNA helicase
MDISDFLPSYPQYEISHNIPLANPYGDEDLYSVIRRKQEFNELTITRADLERPPIIGELKKHQKLIQRFLSIHTPYTGLLLWHEVGTGKTLSAIAVAEAMKLYQPDKRALVLVKGQTVATNFRNEITKFEKSYLVGAINDKGETNQSFVTRKINESYQISTFYRFCKYLSLDSEAGREKCKQMYSSRVIIIDEVHNLRSDTSNEDDVEEKEEKVERIGRASKINKYDILYQFLHIVENCKILLLTATPMKNQSNEFADIMNLILPMNKQIKTGKAFDSLYFNQQHILQHEEEIKSKIKGYISYLRQSNVNTIPTILDASGAAKIDTMPDFVSFVRLEMKGEQLVDYVESYNMDKNQHPLEQLQNGESVREIEIESDSSTGIFYESSQSILCTFPKNYETKQGVHKKHGITKRSSSNIVIDMIRKYNGDGPNDKVDQDTFVSIVNQYSIKYHYILEHLISEEKKGKYGKCFIYCRYIDGSGLFLLENLLQQIGYSKVVSGDSIKKQKDKKKRYCLITSQNEDADPISNSRVNEYLNAYNDPENKNGEYIQIILGSGTISESRSLFCVRHVFIVTPFWNYTETEQAIGRAVRSYSHALLNKEEQTVTIHRLIADVPSAANTQDIISLDKYMYETSYQKDKKIKQIEAIAREMAVDCTFFEFQNKSNIINQIDNSINKEVVANEVVAKDGSRECFYTRCDYQCYTPPVPPLPGQVDTLLKDTYHLFYTEKEYNMLVNAIQHFIYMYPSVTKFSFTLSQLRDHSHPLISSLPIHVLLRCIYDICKRNERFLDSNGFFAYLKEKNDVFFLSYSIFYTREDDEFYTSVREIAPSYEDKEFLDTIINSDREHIFKNLCRFMLDSSLSKDQKLYLFSNNFKENIQELFLKTLVKVKYKPVEPLDGSPFSKNITLLLTLFEGKFINNNIITPLGGKREEYNKQTDAWSEVNIVIDQHRIKVMAEYFLQTDTYHFIGIRDGQDFKIRNLQPDSKNSKFNMLTKKGKGTVCSTIDSEVLNSIIEKCKNYLTVDLKKDKKSDMCNKLESILENHPSFKKSIDGVSFSYIIDNSEHENIRDYLKKNYKEEKNGTLTKLRKDEKLTIVVEDD